MRETHREQSDEMGWANRITVGRGVCTLVVWVLLIAGTYAPATWIWMTAFVLFAIAAATDKLDGAVARRLGEVSQLGRVLDPLVDKLLTIGSMVVLLGVPVAGTYIPAWMVVVMLGRELLVTTLRAAVEAHGGNFQAVQIGKVKMAIQCIAVGGAIAAPLWWAWAHDGLPFLEGLPPLGAPWSIVHLLAWAATIVTVLSGWIYTARAIRLLKSDPAT